MKAIRRVLGFVLIVIGAIWIGQGAGYIGGSFMTNDPTWLYIGVVFVGLGAGLLIWRGPRTG